MRNNRIIKWCLLLVIGFVLAANEQPADQDQRWWINIAGSALAIVSVIQLNRIDAEDSEL